MQEKINALKQLLSEKKKIVITVHRGPDGDAIGSGLGLYNILIQQGHNVSVITPNDYASFLHWLPGNENVIVFSEEEKKATEITEKADLIFLLDFGEISRLDAYADVVTNSSAKKVMIDHHQQPDESVSDILFSDVTACATSQIVFEIIVLFFHEFLDFFACLSFWNCVVLCCVVLCCIVLYYITFTFTFTFTLE